MDWLTLARHYDIARRRLDALDCYEHAADDARRIGAVALTRQRLEQAIELVDAVPAGGRPHLTRDQLFAWRGRSSPSPSRATPASAPPPTTNGVWSWPSADRPTDEVLRSLIPLWSYYASRADLRRATEVAELLRTVLHDRSELFLIENRAGFGMLDWFAGRFVEADLCTAGGRRRRRRPVRGVAVGRPLVPPERSDGLHLTPTSG